MIRTIVATVVLAAIRGLPTPFIQPETITSSINSEPSTHNVQEESFILVPEGLVLMDRPSEVITDSKSNIIPGKSVLTPKEEPKIESKEDDVKIQEEKMNIESDEEIIPKQESKQVSDSNSEKLVEKPRSIKSSSRQRRRGLAKRRNIRRSSANRKITRRSLRSRKINRRSSFKRRITRRASLRRRSCCQHARRNYRRSSQRRSLYRRSISRRSYDRSYGRHSGYYNYSY